MASTKGSILRLSPTMFSFHKRDSSLYEEEEEENVIPLSPHDLICESQTMACGPYPVHLF